MYTNRKLIWAGERHRPYDGIYGVTRYDPNTSCTGFTLFSPAWGSIEYLIDMRGLVAHTWHVDHSNIGELLSNGNLLVQNDGKCLAEIDSNSMPVWIWKGNQGFTDPTHHDFWYDDESQEIWTISSIHQPVIKGFYEAGLEPAHMRNDFLIRINREGDILWSFSILDHLEQICEQCDIPTPIPYYRLEKSGSLSPWAPADWAHTNTIEVLPDTPLGRMDRRFRKGNVLFSLRRLDVIGIVDPHISKIVWCYGPGILDGQHQPTMLENGNLLLFDNGSARGYSIVREIDPSASISVWEYRAEDFFSPKRSGVQRLRNGNTLICEADAGRIFEVTADKEIVWEFWSPFVAQGRHHMGRKVHRATRYQYSYVKPLFDQRLDKIDGEIGPDGKPIRSYTELINLYLLSRNLG